MYLIYIFLSVSCYAFNCPSFKVSREVMVGIIQNFAHGFGFSSLPLIPNLLACDNIASLNVTIMTSYTRFYLEIDDLSSWYEPFKDGLLEEKNGRYQVTEMGNQYLRNICSLFDPNYGKKREGRVFSQAV